MRDLAAPQLPDPEPRAVRAAPGSGGVHRPRDGGDPLLDIYFADIRDFAPLTPAAEAEATHRIQRLEVAEWVALLSHPPAAPRVLHHVRARLGRSTPAGARSLLRFTGLCRRYRGRLPDRHRRALAAAAQELGWKLHDLDRERRLLNDTIAAVHAQPQPRDGGAAARKGAHTSGPYLETVLCATRATAREKERFLFANLRLVVAIAKRYASPRLPLIDLVQEGNIGLMKAVDRYDVRKGYRFSTYASWWIRHYIGRAVVEQGRLVRLPALVNDQRRRAHAAQASFAAEFGRDPSDEEIIAELGIDAKRAGAVGLRDGDAVVSLDQPFGDGPSDRRPADVLVDVGAPDPLEQACLSEWRGELRQMLEYLPAIERSVLRRHYGLDGAEEESLKDIADGLGRSRERARQIAEQGMGRLRTWIG
ncbi:MAG: sigma-70 family RNA polymerase sigma factor [Deltaproteobacteria bacterium]|nr:sigma-70 family RNA polymerase sigma factor [Deltaproteobacteria bacterium]